jgi:prepilin-type N-terminal cleavage/methylation domain-containing protein
VEADAQDGYTFIELLITIVVSGMLLAALASVFVTGINLSGSTTERAKETDDAQVLSSFLVRDAQAAGATNPQTGVTDTTMGIGVATTNTSGCTTTGTVFLQFGWVDQPASASATYHFADYSFASPSNIVRTTCTGVPAASPGSATIATTIASTPVVKCTTNNVLGTCSTPMPDSVSVTFTATNAPAASASAYTYTLTAALRPSRSTPSLSTTAALITLGPCPGVTVGGILAEARVAGDAFIKGTDPNSCINNSGFLTAFEASGTFVSPTVTDPLAGLTPPSTSGLTTRTATSCSGTAQPGVYTNQLSVGFLSTCTFASGVYIFQKGLSVSTIASISSASGGVFFYFPGTATLSASSGVTVSLSPLTTGPYAGISIWQAGSSTLNIGNGAVSNVNGTIYAPNAQVSFSNLSISFSIYTIIASSVSFSNGTYVNIGPPAPPLVINSGTTFPAWTVGQPYPGPTLTGTGGLGTFQWSMSGVPGLSIDQNSGFVSGTPTTAGSFTATVVLNDSFGDPQVQQTFPVTINPRPTVTTASLPNGNKNVAYSQTLAATGGTGVLTWSVSAGTLPPGLNLNTSTGVISGTPTTIITSSFTVTVTDAAGATGSKALSITIGTPPTITSLSPSSRGQGAANQTIIVTGTNFQSGAVVGFSGTGITVNSTSFTNSTHLSVNVTVAANATVGARDVTVTNPDTGTYTLSGGFTVNAAPTVTSLSPSSRGQGASSQTITVTGTNFQNGATASFSGSGITVNSTSFTNSTHLSVNITVAGNATAGAYDITVVNADGGIGTLSGGFTVNAAPTVTSLSPSSQAQNTSNHTITVNGSGFVSGASVSFSGSGITVNSTTFNTSSKITLSVSVSSSATTGARNVTVTNPDGGSYTLTNGFTVISPFTISSVTLTNGGSTAGKVEQNDKIVITFSGQVNDASLCSGWSGTGSQSSTGVVTLTNGGVFSNDTITATAACGTFNFGSLDLGSTGYASSNVNFGASGTASSITWNGTNTLTITLGTASGSGATTVSSSTPKYTASGSVTDAFGDPISNSPFTLPNGKQF